MQAAKTSDVRSVAVPGLPVRVSLRRASARCHFVRNATCLLRHLRGVSERPARLEQVQVGRVFRYDHSILPLMVVRRLFGPGVGWIAVGSSTACRAADHDDFPAGLTTIFPAMRGWIVQIYGYSPGAAKVWEKVSSVSSAADVNVPFLSPIRCGLSSSFFQVTVVPGVTVRLAGRKVKLSILTVAALAAAVGATSRAAVSLGRATAKSEATPTAPKKRATRWRRGA